MSQPFITSRVALLATNMTNSGPLTGKLSRKQYAELRAEWQKKLKDNGFHDLENFVAGEPGQKLSSRGDLEPSFWYRNDRQNRFRYEVTQAYYERASEFLHRFAFECEHDRAVWELHCDGLPYRDIVAKFHRTDKTILATIQRLRGELDRWWEDTRDARERESTSAYLETHDTRRAR